MKLKIFISFMLLSIAAFAGTTPNAAVLKTFNEKFPTATDVKWSMENKTEYEADFKRDGKTVSANFKEDGSWVETEMVIEQKDLPAGVMDYINKNYAGATIKETARIDKSGSTVYEVEIKGEAYLFDESGKFLGESEEE